MFSSTSLRQFPCPFSIDCQGCNTYCPFSHINPSTFHYVTGNGNKKTTMVCDATTWTGPLRLKSSSEPARVPESRKRAAIEVASNEQCIKAKGRKENLSIKKIEDLPIVEIDAFSKVSREQRQKVLIKFYNEFKRIYSSLLDHQPSLAHEHALKQERKLHQTATLHNYVSLSIGILQRLRKRPLAQAEKQAGIDGEYEEWNVSDLKSVTTMDVLFHIEKLCIRQEILEEQKYPLLSHLNIPRNSDSYKLDAFCDRCGRLFHPNDRQVDKIDQICNYHPGFIYYSEKEGSRVYSCCHDHHGSSGCMTGPHVYKIEDFNALTQLIPFTTMTETHPESRNILALDCEMAYTTYGMEIIRVTVVDFDENTLLDELSLTDGEIIDLNTMYSGIQSLTEAKYNLSSIKSKLTTLINPNTILIGHGLENDLKALRLIHTRIVDTSILFPHPKGLPYRFSLRRLSKDILGEMIQQGTHDSKEDAVACIRLIKEYVKKKQKE